jgi:hypothetical protein
LSGKGPELGHSLTPHPKNNRDIVARNPRALGKIIAPTLGHRLPLTFDDLGKNA